MANSTACWQDETNTIRATANFSSHLSQKDLENTYRAIWSQRQAMYVGNGESVITSVWQGQCHRHGTYHLRHEETTKVCPFCLEDKEQNMTENIEVGDLVERFQGGDNANIKLGEQFIVVRLNNSGDVYSNKNNVLYPHDRSNIKLVKKAKTMNNDAPKVGGNALSRLAKSLFNGRVKKFIEVGFLTSDLEVTEKFTRSAMAIVMEDLLSQKKDDVAAVELTVSEVGRRLEAQADEEIQEAKDEKNCCK